MVASFFSKRKRGLTFSTFILLILSIFLLGYFYYFIPVNKEAVHKNGFLILRTIAANIQGKSSSHLSLFANFYNNPKDTTVDMIDNITELLKENNVDADVYNRPVPKSKHTHKLPFKSPQAEGSKVTFKLMGIEDGSFINTIQKCKNNDSIVIKEPLESFLQPILMSQKSELFESYLLLSQSDKNKSQLVYKDPKLGVRSDIAIDSLLPPSKDAFLAGTRELTIEDFNYKMFYYPFDVDAHRLILCGLVKTKRYNANLNDVPFYFIYPLAIAFLLLLVLLPILKFYIMDSNEQVRLPDLFLFSLSVFIGASLITLIIIQYLLWKGSEERVKGSLNELSDQIENSFLREVRKAYNQLSTLDSLLANNFALNKKFPEKKDISDPICIFLGNNKQDPNASYLFSRISWINDSGDQIVKAELYGQPVFTNVSDRKYYQAFKNDETFTLPNDSGKRYSWEAIYSWTNAEFSITVSKKSDWEKARVAALATKMYSIVNAMLPAGYGFCIIDKQGVVQIHSDANRNLSENLFEKIEAPRQIKEAMAGRQQNTFNEVNFYGKSHMVHITPLPGQPFYLVTFYDKGYIVPVNMRVLIFSLLFCFLSFLISMGLLLAIMRKGFYQYPLLYSFMDCLNWVIPRKNECRFYFHSLLCLTLYAIMLLLFIFLCKQYNISNYVIFALVLITPVNVVCSLFVIRSVFLNPVDSLKLKELPGKRKKTFYTLGVHFLISLLFYFYAQVIDYPIESHFLLFQGLLNALMWWYALSKSGSALISYNPSASYLSLYSWMITALIICLSVLPASLYTWYAHNQEINQMVKMQQLYLADNINNRSKMVVSAIRKRDPSYISDDYFDAINKKAGIYNIYKDDIRIERDPAKTESKDQLYDRLYFDIAGKVSNPYYDPQLYPALTDSASDHTWYWQTNDSFMNLWYAVSLHKKIKSSLHITSVMPDRYVYVRFKIQSVWILLLIGILIWSLHKWIRINAEHLFLKKFIKTEGPAGSQDNLITEYYADKNKLAVLSEEELYTSAFYQKYSDDLGRSESDQYEKEILEVIKKGEKLYNYIWDKCSQKEKYLLFDFAQDGLINYKNTYEIYSLINKGLFIIEHETVKLFSAGFRAYLLIKKNTDEILMLHKKFRESSAWQAFRGPLIILLVGIAAFIFFTQETVFQKIIALVAGISSVATILPKVLGGGGKPEDNK